MTPLQKLYAAAIVLTVSLQGCGKAPTAPEPQRAVRMETVQLSGAGGSHEYAAEVRPRVESRLSFRVGGKLISRMVGVGDVVRPGQALAQVDDKDFRLGFDASQAALAVAKANLDVSEAEIRRYRDLRSQGFISSLELERREATLKASRAQAEQALSQAQLQGNLTRYAVLTADVNGIVVGVDAEVGAVVSPGTAVFRIAQDGRRDAVFNVPEDRVNAIRAAIGKAADKTGGVAVKLTVPDQSSVFATVREVAAAADPMTRTFVVKADIGSVNLAIGQSVTVRVESTDALAQAIRLPLAAVFESQGKPAVWIVDPINMKVRTQPIVIGGAHDNEVLVAQGLSPGQVIVTAGVHTLTPGQRVSRYVAAQPSQVDRLADGRLGGAPASTPNGSTTR